MPSPLGHALAGATIALLVDRTGRRPGAGTPDARQGFDLPIRVMACVLFAALPDADLLFQPTHRAFTHSVGSTALVIIIVTAVTGWVTDLRRGVGFGLLCGVAWGSHLVLDWLGADPNPPHGIKALWPFSDQWFTSGADLFRSTERRRIFSRDSILINARAAAQEIAILGPALLVAVWWRRRARGGRGGAPPQRSAGGQA
ncbi:MAG: metal-dependent hydrolase [Vicinamibacterales bacterium]